ncbi:hypothetical protein [Streptomyces sp. NPDC005009]
MGVSDMGGKVLVAAVGSGDAKAVTRLLEAGADPDTLADDGLPVLCREDPRTAEAVERVGSLSRPGYEHDHRLSAIRSWEWNCRNS